MADANGRSRPTWRSILGIAWSAAATLAALYLGFNQFQHSAALSRLDARERLDTYLTAIRDDYTAFCLRQSESLRPVQQDRYDALIAVAAIDASAPPYNAPCRWYERPRPPTGLSIRAITNTGVFVYDNWDEFLSANPQMTLQFVIEGVPIASPMTISSDTDWSAFEELYQARRDQREQCTQDALANPENSFMQVECEWFTDDDGSYALRVIEIRP